MSKQFHKLTLSVGSLLLISSLLSSVPSFAETPSPETTFLTQVIASSGENLSSSELQSRMQSVTKTYLESAPANGREDRLQTALVELRVMTPDQALSFRSAMSANLREQMDSAAVYGAVQRVLANMPGAQFSSYCETNLLAAGLVAVVGEGMFAYVGHAGEGAVIFTVLLAGVAVARGCF